MKPGPRIGQYSRPLKERFWEKVDRRGPDECWPWKRQIDAAGYGRFQTVTTGGMGGSRSSLAHRVAWTLTNGDIPSGQVVRHACDNPPCVNPAHLLLGSHQDNADDRDNRGRLGPRRGEANGHARLTEDDVRAIRRLRGIETTKVIGARYGIARSMVSHIWTGRNWGHVT